MDLQPQLLQIPVYSQGNRERNILGLTGQPAWSKGTIKSRYSERVCLRTIIRLRAIEEVTQHQLWFCQAKSVAPTLGHILMAMNNVFQYLNPLQSLRVWNSLYSCDYHVLP